MVGGNFMTDENEKILLRALELVVRIGLVSKWIEAFESDKDPSFTKILQTSTVVDRGSAAADEYEALALKHSALLDSKEGKDFIDSHLTKEFIESIASKLFDVNPHEAFATFVNDLFSMKKQSRNNESDENYKGKEA
jgi:hypothetical protein